MLSLLMVLREIRTHNLTNLHIGSLSEGCRSCKQGKKLVLYTTGECHQGCFYCPLSEGRQSKLSYANEKLITCFDDILDEAKAMDAKGAGITGGDPLIETERVAQWITGLKSSFGSEFHIHLYTSDREVTPSRLQLLSEAGLDEIRLHPPLFRRDINNSKRVAPLLLEYNWSVGSELPAIPGTEERIIEWGLYIEELGFEFLNLNEFEFTYTNSKKLRSSGYDNLPMLNSAMGSQEAAHKVLEKFRNRSLRVHYCSSRFKDAVQLRNRFKRRAKNVRRPLDDITEDGLLWYGMIQTSMEISTKRLSSFLIDHCDVPPSMIETDNEVLYLPWYVAEELYELLSSEFENEVLYICTIQQHPTDQGQIILEEPLYSHSLYSN